MRLSESAPQAEGSYRKAKVAALANPVTYIDSRDPEMLFLHGDMDNLVSPSQTLLVHTALRSVGVPSTRHVVKGAGHGGPQWSTQAVMDIVVRFFDRTLKQGATSDHQGLPKRS